MMQDNQALELMAVEQLASYLQIAKSSRYKLAQGGNTPGQEVGKHWRFRKDTVNRWLDEQTEARAGDGD